VPDAVEFRISVPLAASDAADLESPGIPFCGEAGDRGWPELGQLAGAKAAFAARCLGSSSAAERLWLFHCGWLCWRRAAVLAMSQTDALGACCPGPPHLSRRLLCCQPAAMALTGEGEKVL